MSKIQTVESAVLHRDIRVDPPYVRGEGKYIIEKTTGRAIFDASCGAGVSILGNTVNKRVRAARDRVEDEVMYASSASWGHEAIDEFAEFLVSSTGGVMKKVAVYNSGSDSMEAALKMAIQYQTVEKLNPEPERVHFVAREESYHGNTISTLALGGHKARRKLFKDQFPSTFHHIPACNEYRQRGSSQSIEEFNAWHAKQLEDKILEIGANKVAAFVAEPIVGAALGSMPAPKGYFKAIKKVLDKYGVLLIFDEIMCGMGRSGTMHAWQHEDVDVAPDIQTVGKGLGGGVEPIAAMLIGKKVSNALENNTGIFVHGYTYQNFPKICAAAHEVWKIVQEENLLENVAKMGKLLEHKLKAAVGSHRFVGNIRGRGGFWSIEFVKNKFTKEPFPPKAEPYNIHIYPGAGTADGISGDHQLLAPPFTINENDVDLIVDRVTRVINDFFAQHYPDL
ncbi:adenosylmethionine-8-amino-7-oxononanoate aminotransferase-like protein [Dendryphion nanum]|uniref:Adenosylmethionine-8-amino-7-oxononanoate aminotransferase-like protein n=1 Tax=Dendryphion nanum TaxID=256645 RepID=A0A9P9IRA6_9PLEO|nr:adenosylmethionine-8-amino-7-oxononanoate aminotransferase-like protein [Dendryphion nanum]